MSNRRATVERIKTDKNEHSFIDVEVSYTKGGINYATYQPQPRGYRLHVQPIEVENKGGFTCTSFTGFTGYQHHIEDANRFSQKKLAEVAQSLQGSDIVKRMVGRVLSEQGDTVSIESINTPDAVAAADES